MFVIDVCVCVCVCVIDVCVCVIDATCFDECFLFHMVTRRHYFWQKLLWDSFNRHIVAFFETSVLKELHILRILSPQCSADNGSANTKVTKWSYHCCTLFIFWLSALFFTNEFLWKTQNLSESMFLHNRIFINSLVFIRWASEAAVCRYFSK